jgi:hypothetical protein
MAVRLAFLAFAFAAFALPVEAATPAPISTTPYKTTMQNLGTGFALGLPLLATGLTIAKHDRAGSAELLVATVLSLGTAYALSNTVREDRPDHSSMHAFPALQTALAGSSSSFILERYGWREGLPAFAASGFVSFALNQAKKEHWYDTLASSAISAGYGLLITKRFHSRYHVTTNFSAAPDGMFASLSYDF